MKQKIIRYSQALEEVGDVFLLVATTSFLTIKLDFLKRKYTWMLNHDHGYQYCLSELISILEDMQRETASKLELETDDSAKKFLFDFGSNMQKIRLEENVTLEELSARSYFNVEELKAIEDGLYYFTDLNDLDHIAEILNSSLRILAGNQ